MTEITKLKSAMDKDDSPKKSSKVQLFLAAKRAETTAKLVEMFFPSFALGKAINKPGTSYTYIDFTGRIYLRDIEDGSLNLSIGKIKPPMAVKIGDTLLNDRLPIMFENDSRTHEQRLRDTFGYRCLINRNKLVVFPENFQLECCQAIGSYIKSLESRLVWLYNDYLSAADNSTIQYQNFKPSSQTAEVMIARAKQMIKNREDINRNLCKENQDSKKRKRKK